MTVAELIEILKRCPQDLAVIVHADNHTARVDDQVRVALLMRGWRVDDPYRRETDRPPRPLGVVLGNISRRQLNYPNEWVSEELDGAPALSENW